MFCVLLLFSLRCVLLACLSPAAAAAGRPIQFRCEFSNELPLSPWAGPGSLSQFLCVCVYVSERSCALANLSLPNRAACAISPFDFSSSGLLSPMLSHGSRSRIGPSLFGGVKASLPLSPVRGSQFANWDPSLVRSQMPLWKIARLLSEVKLLFRRHRPGSQESEKQRQTHERKKERTNCS